MQSRDDEFEELEMLLHSDCRLGVPGGVENKNGKVNILMQSALSRAKIDSFSLVSDSMFVMQVFHNSSLIYRNSRFVSILTECESYSARTL